MLLASDQLSAAGIAYLTIQRLLCGKRSQEVFAYIKLTLDQSYRIAVEALLLLNQQALHITAESLLGHYPGEQDLQQSGTENQ